MTYGFNMGMVIRWDKKIHKEIMPCLTTGSGDNAPHIIIKETRAEMKGEQNERKQKNY